MTPHSSMTGNSTADPQERPRLWVQHGNELLAPRQRQLFFPISDNYNSPRCLRDDVTQAGSVARSAGQLNEQRGVL